MVLRLQARGNKVTYLCGSTQGDKEILSIQHPQSNITAWTARWSLSHRDATRGLTLVRLRDISAVHIYIPQRASERWRENCMARTTEHSMEGKQCYLDYIEGAQGWVGEKGVFTPLFIGLPQVNPYLFTLVLQTDDTPEEMLQSQRRYSYYRGAHWSWLAQEQSWGGKVLRLQKVAWNQDHGVLGWVGFF